METDEHIPRSVLACLPARWRRACLLLTPDMQAELAELRLRVDRPVALVLRGRRGGWLGDAGFTEDVTTAPRFTRDDAERLLQAVSDSSVYALEEQLKEAFMTLPGGHRIGFCGETVLTAGVPRTVKHVGSFMIRIARAVPGCAEALLPDVVGSRGRIYSTLIVSPPGCGKTTLLRDFARALSYGCPRLGMSGMNVGIIDERSEIAATYKGVPQHDLGPRVDVVDNAPKSIGMMQLLRGMAPDVIVTDEIGRREDAVAVQEALHGGVAVFASAHGGSWHDVARRPGLESLVDPVAFARVVVLSNRRGPGTVEAVLDPRKGMGSGRVRGANNGAPGRHKSSHSPIYIG